MNTKKEKLIEKLAKEIADMSDEKFEEGIKKLDKIFCNKNSLPVEAKVSQENGGRYKADIKTIWAVKEIKIGDSKIKIVADTQVPKDEFWFIDENNDVQKFRMIKEKLE